MSAIWGHIDLENTQCLVSSMSSEYLRKCKLDKITEKPFKNALFGSGLQYINDEDELEEMPYIVDDGNTIIASDCILDNRDELIRELNVDEKTAKIPDGKLICLSYAKWHYDFVKHLKGIFSVAIFDSRKKELLLCVDPTASRCLYYYKNESGITFSTLTSPIIKLHKNIEKNEQYIIDFLALPGLKPNYSPTETPWKNVYLIEAGTYVIFSDSKSEDPKITRYFKLDAPKKMSINKARRQFLELYKASAAAVTRTNGEVSVLLSSGLDSSSVAALSADALAHRGKKLHSYTYIPFYKVKKEDYPRNFIVDETEDVKALVKMYPNIDAHFENGEGKSFLESTAILSDILELPFKAYVNLSLFLQIMGKAQKSGSKVVLTGQVGNSTVSFGDINNSLYYLYDKKRFFTLLRYYNGYCKNARISRKGSLKGMLSYLKRVKERIDDDYSGQIEGTNKFVSSDTVKKSVLSTKSIPGYMFRPKEFPMKRGEYDDYTYSTDAFAYIGAMETKLGLYTGTVMRDATRNIDVINFCASLPFEYFCYMGLPRFLIRGVLGDMIPRQILYPLDRYGLQNADWLIRLENEKEDAYKRIEEALAYPGVVRYLDTAAVEKYHHVKPQFTAENEPELKDIFTLYSLFQYFKSID